MSFFRSVLVVFCCSAVLVFAASAETSPEANLDPAYKTLRTIKPTGERLVLDKVVLNRDAAVFTLSGTLCFVPPVEGKVTGAVFMGTGTFSMEPPLKVEKVSLSRLTKQPRIDEEFSELVLRFTDATYDELKKAPGAKASTGGCASAYWNDIEDALQKDRELNWIWNLTARILQDVYSSKPGGLFTAFIKGRKFNGKELYIVDPHGAPMVAPEEVSFTTWDANKNGIWAAFHRISEYADGSASGGERNAVHKIERQQVDLTIAASGRLDGKAQTSFVARHDGVRVIPFELYRTLRVSSVTDESGKKLDFIQEDKDQDSDFSVILPRPLKSGEQFTVITTYGGKDALLNEGSGNFYLAGGARSAWYPGGRFEDYAAYDMRFTFPKNFNLVASGRLDKETVEGNQTIAHWVTDEPQTVAAFQFGRFKKDVKPIAQLQNMSLETYANEDLPDSYKSLQVAVEDIGGRGYGNGGANAAPFTLGSMNTTSMMKKAMAEAEIATRVFTDYFGPTPFKRLAMTQQTADYYGQSWPQLVWLPISYFLDNTIRHQIYGFDPRGYFTVVAPHEIAHQWWGHTITWASYRDQWMSEGFSEAAASIYLQVTSKNNKEFLKFWNDEHLSLTERNREGFRAIDAGPLTLGYRLNNTKVGENITSDLIYPKGAYILHMIRMMMWNPQTRDENFKTMMKDFLTSFRNKPATTEDFQAVVEKHMIPAMDLAGNGTMDWFFDQYVYGTALPSYRLEYGFKDMSLDFTVTQSGVDDNFMMRVPLYLELADGRTVRMGSVSLKGNASVQQKVDLAQIGFKEKPRRVVLAYFYDVLADKIEQK